MKSPKLVVGGVALALTLLIVAAAFAASTNFVEPNSSPVAAGDGPVAVAATDLDADGDADLAVADQGTGTTPGAVTILKNRGSGSFFQPTSSPTPAGLLPAGIAAADFDGDSDPDLAVPNFAGDDVTIQKNNGNGGFFVPASSPEPAGDAPDGIVAADFDGDEDMDLAVVNTSSGNVSILVNNGTGNFAPAASSPIAAGTNPRMSWWWISTVISTLIWRCPTKAATTSRFSRTSVATSFTSRPQAPNPWVSSRSPGRSPTSTATAIRTWASRTAWTAR
jgi:hypothetical protein